MRAFARLLDRLSLHAARNAKLTLVRDFLRETPDPERGWALAALTGELTFDAAKPAFIRKAVEARMDPELFALVLRLSSATWPRPWRWSGRPSPAPTASRNCPRWSTRCAPPRAREVQGLIEGWLDALDADGRWALLKLLTGGLRVGRLGAAGQAGARADMRRRRRWPRSRRSGTRCSPPYEDLFAWLEGRSERPSPDAPGRFRPVMLAQAIDEAVDFAKLDPADYAAEWKWDGIRVQAVSERGETPALQPHRRRHLGRLSRTWSAALNFEGVIDGELLVMRDGRVAPFGDLQQRLNRKTADAKLMAAYPAGIRAYDLLLDGEDDLRQLPFARAPHAAGGVRRRAPARRASTSRRCSRSRAGRSWPPCAPSRRRATRSCAEGLMLKRWDSIYEAGRPKGPWFKWKRDPHLIDAVLMYAQRGHGKRSSFYSDYTFGVWREDEAGQRS